MPGLICEPLPAIGAVRIYFDDSDYAGGNPGREIQILRTRVDPSTPDWFDDLVKVRVRPTYMVQDENPQYGSPWEMFNTADVWYDTEAPLDTPLWYMAEEVGGGAFTGLYYPVAGGGSQLVANGEFEAGITGWTADASGAIAWETAAPLVGAGSLRVTGTGAAASTGARTANMPVAAGRMYGAAATVRSTATSPWRLAIDWLTVASAYLSTSYSAQTTMAAGVTTRRSFAAKAPATAAFAQLRLVLTPATNGPAMLADQVTFTTMGAFPTDDPEAPGSNVPAVILPSLDGGWLSDPTTPSLDVRLSRLPVDGCDVDALVDGTRSGVIFMSHAAEARASVGARFDNVDEPLPVSVTGARRAPTSTLTVSAVSFADRDRVHDLLATGRLAMLRLPAEYGIADRYLDIGDVSTSALTPDLRLPYRVIDMPYASAANPTGPIAGVVGTRIEDLDRYATWADFDAAELTSIDLLYGAGSTGGVITA